MATNGIRTCLFWNKTDADHDSGCLGDFHPGRSDSHLCPRCRANQYYWMAREKRRPGSAKRYRFKLGLRSTRLDEWMGSTHLRGPDAYQVIRPRKERNRGK